VYEFWPKCNSDLMQCVTCNYFSLFVSRPKSSEKIGILMKQEKIPNVVETSNIDFFLYEIEARTTL
jgi:UDP-N-acetylglucosamine pyrophosphorylase